MRSFCSTGKRFNLVWFVNINKFIVKGMFHELLLVLIFINKSLNIRVISLIFIEIISGYIQYIFNDLALSATVSTFISYLFMQNR